METISHRDMRNRSGEILRRVEAGESMRITNSGRPAALIVPIGGDDLDALVERGEARAAREAPDSLASIVRVVAPVSTREVIADSRGHW
ncbi:MAG: type II toxin-antitoxin system Phd/YefM family antitoxin [Beutenbergiaceae bacterium]